MTKSFFSENTEPNGKKNRIVMKKSFISKIIEPNDYMTMWYLNTYILTYIKPQTQ